MIQTEVMPLNRALHDSIIIADQRQTPQLLSITEIIDTIDPFVFFEQAKLMEGNRFFWTSSSDDFYLVGAGDAKQMTVEKSNRFSLIEQQWQEIIADTIIYNPFEVPGTGPIAFGGFSFDPSKQQTHLWSKFKASQFRVPSYLLTIHEGQCYLTVNVIVRAEDHPKQLQYEIEKDKQLLLCKDTTVKMPDSPSVSSKKEIAPLQWKELVKEATKFIHEGNADKIVLAREMQVTFADAANLTPILYQLTRLQSNSFIFAYENGTDCFLGASPERLVRVQDKQLLSTCLAGTAPRGETQNEDHLIGLDLLNDEKNRAEHQFVVEMIQKAVEECCVDVDVPEKPVLYPLKNLQHLYTPVKGHIKANYSIIDVVSRLHPTPALGGLPRDKSLAFIREKELMDRGWYGAPIGWMGTQQNGEFAVAIRSALIKGKQASLFSGCGVVKDSDPEAEYQETNIKFAPMLSVLGD
ncbi:isochorismate synthase MenF [Radiobacillus sp. PE A8.2]|uniref:isochorismate synthase n=1 Tax=Radiobacillus sp. PE A8.2 TaxID=3380349 RepID=UPI00388D7B03